MGNFEKDLRGLNEELDEYLEETHPKELTRHMRDAISVANYTPAFLYTLSARVSGQKPDTQNATGVQLVHAGLNATRRVLDDDGAWEEAGVEPVEEDMILLAAEILVANGFDQLLNHYEDHYEGATRVINSFSSNKACEMDATSPEEGFKHELDYISETYETATGMGCDDNPLEEIVSLAEGLAIADCIDIYTSKGDVENASFQQHIRRAAHLAGDIRLDGYEMYVEAVRNESAFGDLMENTRGGVEAQD